MSRLNDAVAIWNLPTLLTMALSQCATLGRENRALVKLETLQAKYTPPFSDRSTANTRSSFCEVVNIWRSQMITPGGGESNRKMSRPI